MGIAKNFDYKEQEIQEKVKILYDRGGIEDEKCRGIAKQIIDKGMYGLSDKQLYLFRQKIEPLFDDIVKCYWCNEITHKDECVDNVDEAIYWCSDGCLENAKKSKFCE